MSLFHLSILLHLFDVGIDVCSVSDETLTAAGRGDEDIEPLRHGETSDNDEDSDMANTKSEDVQWVVSELVKARIGEAVDNG